MTRFNIDKEIQSAPEATKMSKQEANEKLSEMVDEVYAKLAQAQKFADKHGLSFSLNVEYGMGGYYEEGEWFPSSGSC